MTKIINTKTWEILDENYIEVDKLISETICILNKKGYKTLACCEGHINSNYHKEICDISSLEKVKNNFNDFYIEDITEKDFVLLWQLDKATIYIKFDKDYKFEKLPEGFKKFAAYDEDINDWSKEEFDGIERRIEIYKNNQKRDYDLVDKEIKKYNEILLNWAKELPSFKK